MKVHFPRTSLSASLVPWFTRPRLRNPMYAVVLTLAAVAIGGVQIGGAQTTPAGTKLISGNSENGKLAYQKQGCDGCHGSYGEGVSETASKGGAPRIASTTLGLPAFIEIVRSPKGAMPPYGSHQLPDKELKDVYAFLQTSTPGAGREASVGANLKNGQRLFKEYGCSECHLAQGEGSRSTGGTRIGPPQIPLSAFIQYVRAPAREMPPYTQRTVTDQELKDIYAFLQSIPQPPSWKTIPLLNHSDQ